MDTDLTKEEQVMMVRGAIKNVVQQKFQAELNMVLNRRNADPEARKKLELVVAGLARGLEDLHQEYADLLIDAPKLDVVEG